MADLVAALRETAGDRIVLEEFDAAPQAWAVRLTATIRALDACHLTLDDVRGAGRAIATWRSTRSLGWVTSQLVAFAKQRATGAPSGARADAWWDEGA